ncbi:MAG: haloacid dehalogenase type II [Pseudomonadota bacterium]
MGAIKACVFDAYGTLFDVNAAARDVAAQPGKEVFSLVWQQVAQDWRAKTLQYTWLREIGGAYVDFWQITEDALDWALAAADQTEPELRAELLGLFWTLKAYPEVADVLTALVGRGVRAAILSNGTPRMLAAAVKSAGIEDTLDAVLSVDAIGRFKPASEVYALVEENLGYAPADVLFVSSNGWDVAGAAAFGFDTLWVNRAGEPVDRLPGRPGAIAADLRALPDIVAERVA